jgi:cytochrome c
MKRHYYSQAPKLMGCVLGVTLGTQAALSAEKGDPELGADVFKKCRACHMLGVGARSAVGPPLNGIVGRKAGAVDGYAYSDNMRELGAGGLRWNEDQLDRYLANPKSMVPRGKMAFPGLRDPLDRADLIAYLKSFGKQ